MAERGSLLDRGIDRIRQKGVVNFLFATITYMFPEPYSTRLYARGEVLSDACTSGSSAPHSPAHVLRACRHGFTQDLYSLYRLDEDQNPTVYLDEVSRRHARLINDQPDLLDDKKQFYRYLRDRGFDEYLPDIYGHVKNGTFVSDRYVSLRDVVTDQQWAVIKGHRGSCGDNVYICTADEEDILLHGKDGEVQTASEEIQDFDDYLVTEYCEQADYLDRIYPDAANTLRVPTLRTNGNEILIPAAVHRIGSERTGVLDNFSQGGMSAEVDMETGELSEAAEPRDGQKPRWHESHPDTGAQIAGTIVPGWDRIKDEIRTIASGTEAFDYVGWDLVVTSPGEFKIIEANSYPDPDVLQVHRPLLVNDGVRQFFQHRGVVP